MARLSSRAEYGFDALPGYGADPNYVANCIASYIHPAPQGSRLLDPCAGEGEAVAAIARALGITPDNIWLNEFTEGRAKKCERYTTNRVLHADGKLTLQATKHFFNLIYTNAPFDEDSSAQGNNEGKGSSRLEWLFFDRIIEQGRWLMPGGVHVMVAPRTTFMKQVVMNHLARWYQPLTLRRVPDDAVTPDGGHYIDTVIIIGTLLPVSRSRVEVNRRVVTIHEKLRDLPETANITMQAEPRYTLPQPKKIAQFPKVVWRDSADANPVVGMLDLLKSGGAHAASKYRKRVRRARAPREHLNPLMPHNIVAAALRIADGAINGQQTTIAGEEVWVKGRTKIDTLRYKEEKVDSKGVAELTHNITRRTPHVTTIGVRNAKVRQYSGDMGMKKFMEIPDAAQQLIRAVEATAPSRYRMQVPDDVQGIINQVKSVSGRHLPGYPVGFTPMQEHVITATYMGFVPPKPDQHAWNNVIMNAQMGCGKSSMSAAVAKLLWTLSPTNYEIVTGPEGEKERRWRPWRGIYVAPNHLIGSRAAVEEFDKLKAQGKTGARSLFDIAQILAEWRDLIPEIKAEILESPQQVSRFFADPSYSWLLALSPSEYKEAMRPKVGFISFSKYSLGSGWEMATTRHKPRVNVDYFHDMTLPEHIRALRTDARWAWYQQLEESDKAMWDARSEELKELKKKRAQKASDANGGADANDETVGMVERSLVAKPGVSERTLRRDRLFRCGVAYNHMRDLGQMQEGESYDLANDEVIKWRRPILQMTSTVFPRAHYAGQYCPTCGNLVRDRKGAAAPEKWKSPGIVACIYCGDRIGSIARTMDNVEDRDLMVYRNPPSPALDPKTNKAVIPWGSFPRSNSRMALGEFIASRYSQRVDLFVADEAHAHKSEDSARGDIFGRLVSASKRSLALTGTLYGGKASTVYYLLLRMMNPTLWREFGWTDVNDFIERMGVMDTITKEYITDADGQAFSGKEQKPTSKKQERAGITAELASVISSQCVMILLKNMGFKLPAYNEGVQYLKVPAAIAEQYDNMIEAGKDIIKEPGGSDALSSYLQAGLTYALMPWKPMTIRSKKLSAEFEIPAEGPIDMRAFGVYRAPAFSSDMVLPHHEWLAEYLSEQKKRGRRSILFVQHTNKLDIIPDLMDKVARIAKEQHGTALKIAVMRSSVKSNERVEWLANAEASGVDVVICHPQLVETGLNLIGWPSIVFVEPTYQLATALQARMRGFRPTQTKDCEVTWLAYADTMLAQAMALIGEKAMAATLLMGDEMTSGLLQFSQSMSLLTALAQAALNGDTMDTSIEAVAAKIAAASQAMVADYNEGAEGLVLPEGMTVEDVLRRPDAPEIIGDLFNQLVTAPEIPEPVPVMTVEPHTVPVRNVAILRAIAAAYHIPAPLPIMEVEITAPVVTDDVPLELSTAAPIELAEPVVEVTQVPTHFAAMASRFGKYVSTVNMKGSAGKPKHADENVLQGTLFD